MVSKPTLISQDCLHILKITAILDMTSPVRYLNSSTKASLSIWTCMFLNLKLRSSRPSSHLRLILRTFDLVANRLNFRLWFTASNIADLKTTSAIKKGRKVLDLAKFMLSNLVTLVILHQRTQKSIVYPVILGQYTILLCRISTVTNKSTRQLSLQRISLGRRKISLEMRLWNEPVFGALESIS